MSLRLAVSVGIMLAAGASTASAQRLSRPFAVAPRHLDSASSHAPGFLGPNDRDYRYTGFYVGLVAGAGLGIYAIAECAGQNECAVRPVPFAILTTFVFSVTGALIGGMIPK
jgi:hypothetical protein